MFTKIFLIVILSCIDAFADPINSIIFKEHFDQCGIMSSSAGLIQGGFNSTQTQFPWIAILSVRTGGIWDQNGSGSLISRRHVLVKSRYVATLDEYNKYIAISPEDVEIFLGTTQYNDLSQEGSIKMDVTKINLYPNSRKIDEDMKMSLFNFAILTLESDVNFSDIIKPVCLWTHQHNTKMHAGQKLMAVGYGRDLTGEISKIRKHVAVQVTNSYECEQEYAAELEMITESRFFCIKEIVSGHGPCKFDSQLFMKVGSVWYLKGEMISSRINPDTLFCEVSFPIVVEDISDYVEWIDEQIRSELVEIYMNANKRYGLVKVIDVEKVVDNAID